MRQDPAIVAELPGRIKKLVKIRGSLLSPPDVLFGFLLLDFSVAHGRNAEYSAGRNTNGSGRAVTLILDDGRIEGMHITDTDRSALV